MPTDPASPPTPFHLIDLSRRGFLRGAVLAGGGAVAATVAAACTPAAKQSWTFAPIGAAATPGPAASPAETPPATPGESHEHGGPGASPGTDDHDANAAALVKRFLDGEAAAVDGLGNQAYGA